MSNLVPFRNRLAHHETISGDRSQPTTRRCSIGRADRYRRRAWIEEISRVNEVLSARP